jgi:hypothetical protein
MNAIVVWSNAIVVVVAAVVVLGRYCWWEPLFVEPVAYG